MIPAEKLRQVIAILGSDGIEEDDIETRILDLVSDEMMARRLIDWIPEVFGLVLVSHMSRVNLPTTFSAKSAGGTWKEIELAAEPIVQATLPVATEMFHSEPRDAFQIIANRSSALAAAKQAISAGESLEGATFSGPALIGISADVCETRGRSWWDRLLR